MTTRRGFWIKPMSWGKPKASNTLHFFADDGYFAVCGNMFVSQIQTPTGELHYCEHCLKRLEQSKSFKQFLPEQHDHREAS